MIYGFTGGLDKSGYSPGSMDKSSIYSPFIPKPADILQINDCEKDNEANEIYISSNNTNNADVTCNNNKNSSAMMSSFHTPNDQTPDIMSPRLQRQNSQLYQSVTGLNALNAVYQSTTELCTCPHSGTTTTTAVVGLPSRTSLYSLYSTFGGAQRQPESVLICPSNLVSQDTQEKKIVPV